MYSMNLQMSKLTPVNILINFSMLQRFVGFIDIDGAYWTLAIELIFYFLIVLLLILKSTAKIIPYFVAFIVVIFISRVILSKFLPDHERLIQIFGQFRFLHLFLAGIIFYKIHTEGLKKIDLILLLFCLICNLGANLRFNVVIETIIVLACFIIFSVLTMKENNLLNALNFPVLQFLGKISYPMYLLNENFGESVFTFINSHFNLGVFSQIIIVISVVISLSTLIHYAVEKPLFKYLHRTK